MIDRQLTGNRGPAGRPRRHHDSRSTNLGAAHVPPGKEPGAMATTVRTLENFIGGGGGGGARGAGAAGGARAVRAARGAQPGWAALSAWERARACHAIADLIEERREEFARGLSLEQGKPYRAEARAAIDA